jgi:capping protein beta
MSETAVYDLLRRVPPSRIKDRLYDAIHLASPDLTDTLLSTVDIPLKVVKDTDTDSSFLACEFNRDLDSFRSPFSNKYFPQLPDGQKIPSRLRNIEVRANTAFNAYRNLYFHVGQSVASVYLWEIDAKIFGFGVFIKNVVDTKLRTGEAVKGSIDCTDVVEVDESTKEAKYTLTASVLLAVEIDVGLGSPLTLSGSTSERKTVTKHWDNEDDHIVNCGELIESNAAHFRDTINTNYVSHMKHILELIAVQERGAMQDALAQALKARLGKK